MTNMTKKLWVILMVQWYLSFHMDPYGPYHWILHLRSTSYLGHHAAKAPPVGVVRHLALHLVAWVPWTILDRCRLPTTLKGSLSVKKLLGEPLDLYGINRGYTNYNLHWILHQLFWLRGCRVYCHFPNVGMAMHRSLPVFEANQS